jgi:enoyl-CoA hydratase/carnithine racemase
MTPPAPVVHTRIHDGVKEIVLNRPEKKNALTREMYRCLAEGLETADRLDAVRVVLMRGAGDCFCSGNDVTDFEISRDPDRKSPGMVFKVAQAVVPDNRFTNHCFRRPPFCPATQIKRV